jgi:hypothetical protein
MVRAGVEPGGALCGNANSAHSGGVTIGGATSICNGPAGACLPNFDANEPILTAGSVTELHGFRCTATPTTITCVVATGAATGRGFSISNDGATAVGG